MLVLSKNVKNLCQKHYSPRDAFRKRNFLDLVSILVLLETLLGSLGVSRAALGVSWPPLGFLLEVSWEALGTLLDALGRLLGRSWPDFDAILGVFDRSQPSQDDPGSIFDPLRVDFEPPESRFLTR